MRHPIPDGFKKWESSSRPVVCMGRNERIVTHSRSKELKVGLHTAVTRSVQDQLTRQMGNQVRMSRTPNRDHFGLVQVQV